MEQKKLFKIGELSKLYGIGVDSIRYYEKMGILHPIRNEENNYRQYTVKDVRKLTMIRELLNLNFSIEQIKRFDQDRNIANTKNMLEQELAVVNTNITELLEKRENIQARLEALSQHPKASQLEKVQLLSLDARECLMVSDKNLPDDAIDYFLIQYMHSEQKKVDTIGACDCYTLDTHNSNPNSDFLRTKNVFFYSKTLPYESNYTLPKGYYLSLLYQGSLTKTKILLPKLYAYAQEHNLTVLGDPMEFCHIDDYETSYEEEYLTELQISVQK